MTRSDLYYIKNYPFSVLARKAFLWPFRKLKGARLRKKWTQKEIKGCSLKGSLSPHFKGVLAEPPQNIPEERAAFLLDAFMAHRFDILGSGWIEWSYEAAPTGIEGLSYSGDNEETEGTSSIGKLLFKKDQKPIAWHRDMKSGFRWPSDRWWKDSIKAHKGVKGADPKVPIELGRLQHLPRIPVLIKTLGRDPTPFIQEYHDQVRDFLNSNPPGIGLNWTYSMDVGIRAMNLLLAWDLFKEIDEEGVLDQSFDRLLHSSVADHARYILDHLEFQDGLSGNHYLYNIIGLLFAGFYIEGSIEADAWLHFAIPELIRELFKQFDAEGMNFEGSTAYHRFSTEGILWASALILGNKDRLQRMGWEQKVSLSRYSLSPGHRYLWSTADEPLPQTFLDRLYRASSIARALTKPDGRFAQIGDNDSGMAFRMTPIGEMLDEGTLADRYEGRGKGERFSGHEELFDEDQLELFSLNALTEAVFDERPSEKGGAKAAFEYQLARSLKREEAVKAPGHLRPSIPKGGDRPEIDLPYEEGTEIPFGTSVDIEKGDWSLFPDSGLYIYSTTELHLTISAWSGNGLRHTMGHVHCDRLSFELQVKGQDLVVDPGSYIYGALPHERDRFRSGEVHNIPQVKEKAQLWWSQGSMGLFFARSDARCSMLWRDERSLSLLLEYQSVRHERTFYLEPERTVILDRSDHPFEVRLNRGNPHSWGYGKKLRSEG